MTDDQIRLAILSVLDAGCGVVLSPVIDQVQRWRTEDGHPLTPRGLRRLSIALSLLVPLFLYGVVICLAFGVAFDFLQAGWFMTEAFVFNQGAHGEKQLPDVPANI